MTSPKRIAYLVSRYPAVNHTYILREIRELRKLNWDINVAAIRPDTRALADLTTEEQDELSNTWCVIAQGFSGAVRAHLVSIIRHTRSYIRGLLSALGLGGLNLGNAIRSLFYFTEAVMVGQWMQSRGLSHIHVHFSSTVGLLIAKTFPVTISITIHGPAEFQEPASFHLREKIQVSTFICAISNYGRNELMKNCSPDQWGKLETVPLGIDPGVFIPASKASFDRKSFNVICVGRLSTEKAQTILIDAVAELVKEGRSVHLRLVGEGPDRSALEKHVVVCGLSDIVRLEGALNQDQLKILYRESDAFALPSFAEGVPVVLMEAMAMEIPCVATRICGVPELIEDGVDGLLVTPSDTGHLAAAIARLMDDPVLRRRIACAGRHKILEKYDLARNVHLLSTIFEKWVL